VSLPDFLPPKIQISGKAWESVLTELYQVFKKDFIEGFKTLYYKKRKVVYDSRIIEGEKEEAFWHVITKNYQKQGRLPDYDRAAKLSWVRPIIENHSHPDVVSWSNKERKNKITIYLWLKVHEFVVIMRKSKNVVVLVTAYEVGSGYRNKLQKRYEERM